MGVTDVRPRRQLVNAALLPILPEVQHRHSTRARVEGDLRKHLYPALGGRPLNSITRSDVQAWVTQLSQQLAPAKVAVVYSFLATILKSAVADGIIAATPATRSHCQGSPLRTSRRCRPTKSRP